VLIGRHPRNAAAKEKLIPKPPDTGKTGPKGKFSEFASKIFSVPKSEIDKREQQWKEEQGSD
jgi:hypothetical protein